MLSVAYYLLCTQNIHARTRRRGAAANQRTHVTNGAAFRGDVTVAEFGPRWRKLAAGTTHARIRDNSVEGKKEESNRVKLNIVEAKFAHSLLMWLCGVLASKRIRARTTLKQHNRLWVKFTQKHTCKRIHARTTLKQHNRLWTHPVKMHTHAHTRMQQLSLTVVSLDDGKCL